MKAIAWVCAALLVGLSTSASSAEPASSQAGRKTGTLTTPFTAGLFPEDLARQTPLYLVDDPGTIYAPLEPPRPDTGENEGGVSFKFVVNYMTDYVYRGLDRGEVGAFGVGAPLGAGSDDIAEDAPNLQFDGRFSFDLGRAPHPFVGVFVNVYNDDPISRFQEVRPYAGLDWNIRPLLLTAGWQAYIYPERDDFNTSEIFARVEFDDSVIWKSDRPIFSPYVFAAYDIDQYDGFYLEAGVRYEILRNESGVSLAAVGAVGYVLGNSLYTRLGEDDTGFQHYDVGLVGSYSLNTLFNVSRRYGEWKLNGYLYYTDGIDRELRADTQLWGGVGISFEY